MTGPASFGPRSLAERVGRDTLAWISGLGAVFQLLGDVLRLSVRPPYLWANLLAQLDFVGAGSVFIVAVTGTFAGMVFAHQTSRAFEMFDAEGLVGPSVALTVTRELSPVFSALMVTLRAGSATCTELGTMRVTEQVDALETMAMNPVQYLLVPRVLSGLLMVPALVMLVDAAGIAGAYGVAVHVKGSARTPSTSGRASGWSRRTSWKGSSRGRCSASR